MFGKTCNFNEVMEITPFVRDNIHKGAIDENYENPNSDLWTTCENQTGNIGGHKISEGSPLQDVLNGVYKFEIQDPLIPQTRHCYIGKSTDSLQGIKARITQEVWRLRGYPERGQIIKILQNHPDCIGMNAQQRRVYFRRCVFNSPSDVTSKFFVEVPRTTDLLFFQYALNLKLKVKTSQEEIEFFANNMTFQFIDVSVAPSDSPFDDAAISLLEAYALIKFNEAQEQNVQPLNTRDEGEYLQNRLNDFKNQINNYEPTEIIEKLRCKKYPGEFVEFIKRALDRI